MHIHVTTCLDKALGAAVKNLMAADSARFSFSATTNDRVGWNFHPCVLVVFIHGLHDSPLVINVSFGMCIMAYLVNMTRPDLAFAYSQLSKFVQYPGVVHLQAAERVLQYVRDTYDQV